MPWGLGVSGSWCPSRPARGIPPSLFIPDPPCTNCAERFLCSRCCWAHSDAEQSGPLLSSGSRQSDGGGGQESNIPLAPPHGEEGYCREVQHVQWELTAEIWGGFLEEVVLDLNLQGGAEGQDAGGWGECVSKGMTVRESV